MNTPLEHVSTTEIAELTAWLARLSAPGHIDPAERAAFHIAKAHLSHASKTPTPRPTPARTADD
jgi:hypothetical protein